MVTRHRPSRRPGARVRERRAQVGAYARPPGWRSRRGRWLSVRAAGRGWACRATSRPPPLPTRGSSSRKAWRHVPSARWVLRATADGPEVAARAARHRVGWWSCPPAIVGASGRIHGRALDHQLVTSVAEGEHQEPEADLIANRRGIDRGGREGRVDTCPGGRPATRLERDVEGTDVPDAVAVRGRRHQRRGDRAVGDREGADAASRARAPWARAAGAVRSSSSATRNESPVAKERERRTVILGCDTAGRASAIRRVRSRRHCAVAGHPPTRHRTAHRVLVPRTGRQVRAPAGTSGQARSPWARCAHMADRARSRSRGSVAPRSAALPPAAVGTPRWDPAIPASSRCRVARPHEMTKHARQQCGIINHGRRQPARRRHVAISPDLTPRSSSNRYPVRPIRCARR